MAMMPDQEVFEQEVLVLPGVLDSGNPSHVRLYRDLDVYATQAGIAPNWVVQSAAHLTKAERRYLVRFHKHTCKEDGDDTPHRYGLVLSGKPQVCDAGTRFAAYAGFLTRNFLLCRYMTLNEMVDRANDPDLDQNRAILVPNFYVKQDGDALPAWRRQVLFDLLLHRRALRLQTILYVEDAAGLRLDRGAALADLLETHYEWIGL